MSTHPEDREREERLREVEVEEQETERIQDGETPYERFRWRTDPPPWGLGKDDEREQETERIQDGEQKYRELYEAVRVYLIEIARAPRNRNEALIYQASEKLVGLVLRERDE